MNTRVDGSVFGFWSESRNFTDGRANRGLGLSEGRVDCRLMSEDEGWNELLVEKNRSVARCWGVHQPQHEDAFWKVVEWDPEEEDVRKELEKGEEGVSYPVGQPLGVVILPFALNCLDWGIGGIDKSNEVAEESGAISNDQVKGRKRNQA